MGNLLGRGSGRAATESQLWVSYESALARAPGIGGWGWAGEGSSHARSNQAARLLSGTGASPTASPILSWAPGDSQRTRGGGED